MTVRQHLMLVGGGHAHLEVVRHFAARPVRGARISLISQSPHHHYSSVVPGYLQGQQDESDFTFDLPALCAVANVAFVHGYAETVHASERSVEVRDNVRSVVGTRRLTYDWLSIDVGSDPSGVDTPGVREFAMTLRPMSQALALKQRLELGIAHALAKGREQGSGATKRPALPVCIVGAGAGGVEVALAIARRLRDARVEGPITLVDHGPTILADYSATFQRRMTALLTNRGVRVLTDRRVSAVTTDGVHLANGSQIDASLTVWITGAAAPALLRASVELTRDSYGYLLVDDTLNATGDARIWGAGDCITFRDHSPVAKAGVYAVREAPILAHNLRAALEGRPFRHYTPQRRFLSILDTADDRAMLRWRDVSVHARWALTLKRWIDGRFVRTYQTLAEQVPCRRVF